jgi:hypothetical protein
VLKAAEKVDGQSCWNKAAFNEMTFILLGRDAAAPVAIRAWIVERIRLGKNQPGDHQIEEAERCAQFIERGGFAKAEGVEQS